MKGWLLFLKVLLAVLLFAAGIVFLLHGAGVSIPKVTYEGLEVVDFPMGGLLLVVGVCILYFWRPKVTETHQTVITTQRPDGTGKTTTTTTTTTDFSPR